MSVGVLPESAVRYLEMCCLGPIMGLRVMPLERFDVDSVEYRLQFQDRDGWHTYPNKLEVSGEFIEEAWPGFASLKDALDLRVQIWFRDILEETKT